MLRTPSLLLLCSLSVLALTTCGNAPPAQAPLVTRTVSPSPTPSLQGPPLTLTFGCPDLTKEGFIATTTHGRACVSTQPGALLTIMVTYCTLERPVPDHSPALQGTFQADSAGFYEWSWQPQAPQATCVQGGSYTSASATVTAARDGQTIMETATVQIG